MKLSPSFSSYLDFLRFGAAFTVLVGHMVQDGFALAWLPFAHLSHEAVIVFFLMSGYIVYASTVSRHTSALDYVVARTSRIYSVAVPAVVFCVLLSVVLAVWFPSAAAAEQSWRPFSLLDIGASLLFLNESWGAPTDLTLNGPYWSLCYEVWYYVFFGLFFFVRSGWRWPLLVVAAAVAGPAIVVLFPIWVFGAWLASGGGKSLAVGPLTALAVWLTAPLLIWLIDFTGFDLAVVDFLHSRVPGFWQLRASQALFTDYLTALALGAHLAVYPSLPVSIRSFFERSRAVWVPLAGFSFTLYLFHRPLTAIAGNHVPPELQTVPVGLVVLALVLATCWLMSFVTERRLPGWRAGFRRLLQAAGMGSAPSAERGTAR